MSGLCVGQGFQPHICSLEPLIKKLEARAAKWQGGGGQEVSPKKSLDLDSVMNTAWLQRGSTDDTEVDIIDTEEEEGLRYIAGSTVNVEKAVPLKDGKGRVDAGVCGLSTEFESPERELVLHATASSSEIAKTDLAGINTGNDRQLNGTIGSSRPLLECMAGTAVSCDQHVAQLDAQPSNALPPISSKMGRSQGLEDVSVSGADIRQHSRDTADTAVTFRAAVEGCVPQHGTSGSTEPSDDEVSIAQHQELAHADSEGDEPGPELLDSDASLCGSLAAEGSADEAGSGEDAMPLLVQADNINDEEDMLEAKVVRGALEQEARRLRKRDFYDQEAEQSDDEQMSSDEEDGEDEYEMDATEVAEIQKELAEKGIGLKELAGAHGDWQDEQDEVALKRIKRALKYGFTRTRRQAAMVGEEDLDEDAIRERRLEAVGGTHIWDIPDVADVSDLVKSQRRADRKKRKLAAKALVAKRKLVSIVQEPQAAKEAYAAALTCTTVQLPDIASPGSPRQGSPLLKGHLVHSNEPLPFGPKSSQLSLQNGFFSSTLLGRKLHQSEDMRAAASSAQGSFVFGKGSSTSLPGSMPPGSRSLESLPSSEPSNDTAAGCTLHSLVGALGTAICGSKIAAVWQPAPAESLTLSTGEANQARMKQHMRCIASNSSSVGLL